MSQLDQKAKPFQGTVASPCINICDLDDDSICVGCYRAIEEIAGWGMLDNAEKLDVLELAKKRREAAE